MWNVDSQTRYFRISSIRTWLCNLLTLLVLLSSSLEAAVALNNPTSATNPSSGDLDIDLDVPTLFRIGGITDVAFGSYTGSGSLVADRDICVWTNDPSGGYRITAKGDGTSFAFVVSKVGDVTKQIPYAVKWNTASGTSGNVALTANSTSANLTGANTVSSTCATGPSSTANFQIIFTQSDLLSKGSGAFTGVLTLVISAPS